jgi:hypothetical protein
MLISRGMLDSVAEGSLEITDITVDGELMFRMTKTGEKRAEDMMRKAGIDPESIKPKPEKH